MPAFHEVRFPTAISYGAVGGPAFRTTIFTRQSGFEDRNVEWSYARAEYDVAMAIKTQAELDEVRAFFFARRGRAYGFRFKDWSDYKSCTAIQTPAASDQVIGTGDGSETRFQLVKTYYDMENPYVRVITKPVQGSVKIAVDGAELTPSTDFIYDHQTGIVTLASPPGTGAEVTSGFQFDVPVRFDTDTMLSTLEDYNVNTWGQIPLKEVRNNLDPAALSSASDLLSATRWLSDFSTPAEAADFVGIPSDVFVAGKMSYSDGSFFSDGSGFHVPSMLPLQLTADAAIGATTLSVTSTGAYPFVPVGGLLRIGGKFYTVSAKPLSGTIEVSLPLETAHSTGEEIDATVIWSGYGS